MLDKKFLDIDNSWLLHWNIYNFLIARKSNKFEEIKDYLYPIFILNKRFLILQRVRS